MLTLAVAPNAAVHDLWVGAGLAVALGVFWLEKRRRGQHDPRLWAMVGIGLGWGAVFARLGTYLGQAWGRPGASVVEHFLHGNRSILGGLAGAYAGVLVAKRATGYRARTGAYFAPAVAAGMAVGRIGCLLTETPGTQTGLPWGVTLSPTEAAALGTAAGVPLHPSFVYEIAFHLIALGLLLRHRDRLREPADLFTLWLTSYAVFRFAVEFVRGNEIVWAGLTWPQLLLAGTAPLLLWRSVVALRRGTVPLAPDAVTPVTTDPDRPATLSRSDA